MTIPAVTADHHHVSVPTTPPKLIVDLDDASSSFNVTEDNTQRWISCLCILAWVTTVVPVGIPLYLIGENERFVAPRQGPARHRRDSENLQSSGRHRYGVNMINMRRVETGIVAARSLARQVVGELDPAFWAHETSDTSAAADLADYVVGATQAVGSNLQTLAVHFENYTQTRYAQDGEYRMNMSKTGKPYPLRRDPGNRYDDREIQLDAYERAVFVSIGSVLDTLAAALIGFAGLKLDIHRADFAWLLPMHADAYPTEAFNKRLYKALADEGTNARTEQIKMLRAFAVALTLSGPDGWVEWALGMRNMYVHREHRTEFILLGRSKKILTVDRVPIADPAMSNLRALKGADQYLEGYYLKEDILTTMGGLVDSLNAAATGTIEVLRHLWDERRANPSLIPQPPSRWSVNTRPFAFEGYAPGTAEIRKGVSMISNPDDFARLRAGGLITDRR